jgi:hypothetical protein
MKVKVQRIPFGNDHDDAKWLVLEGSIEGCPAVTKRRTINTAALADGSLTLDAEKARLVADVKEYFGRWQAVQQALKEL